MTIKLNLIYSNLKQGYVILPLHQCLHMLTSQLRSGQVFEFIYITLFSLQDCRPSLNEFMERCDSLGPELNVAKTTEMVVVDFSKQQGIKTNQPPYSSIRCITTVISCQFLAIDSCCDNFHFISFVCNSKFQDVSLKELCNLLLTVGKVDTVLKWNTQ